MYPTGLELIKIAKDNGTIIATGTINTAKIMVCKNERQKVWKYKFSLTLSLTTIVDEKRYSYHLKSFKAGVVGELNLKFVNEMYIPKKRGYTKNTKNAAIKGKRNSITVPYRTKLLLRLEVVLAYSSSLTVRAIVLCVFVFDL